MNKAEWNEMAEVDKNLLVAEMFRGWTRPAVTSHAECAENSDEMLWRNAKGHATGTQFVPKSTTDRNACVLVLSAIRESGEDVTVRMLNMIAHEAGLKGHCAQETLWDGLVVDADLICYCAVKAVEEE